MKIKKTEIAEAHNEAVELFEKYVSERQNELADLKSGFFEFSDSCSGIYQAELENKGYEIDEEKVGVVKLLKNGNEVASYNELIREDIERSEYERDKANYGFERDLMPSEEHELRGKELDELNEIDDDISFVEERDELSEHEKAGMELDSLNTIESDHNDNITFVNEESHLSEHEKAGRELDSLDTIETDQDDIITFVDEIESDDLDLTAEISNKIDNMGIEEFGSDEFCI